MELKGISGQTRREHALTHPFNRMNLRLRQLVASTFKVDPNSLNPESGPHTIPAWDSAGHLNLVLAIEKEFGIQFSEDDVVDLIDLGEIEAALQKRGVSA